jgi:hypothetical protein
MEMFHKAEGDNPHERFLKWVSENPHGFFVNRRTPNDMMLHRVTCHQLTSSQPHEITASLLICSPDRKELEDWVGEQGLIPLKLCDGCKPWR